MWRPEERAGKWVLVMTGGWMPLIRTRGGEPEIFDSREDAQSEADVLNRLEVKN